MTSNKTREIKFRAWDNKNKMFAMFGFHIIGETTVFDCIKQYNLEECLELEITQYTECTDKNDKEIYEGDIVEYTFPNGSVLKGVVSWIAGMFVLDFPDQTDSGPIGFLMTENLKVIGNIYENN